jgi:hypothetical protein
MSFPDSSFASRLQMQATHRADGGARRYTGDAERAAYLFRRYTQLTSLRPAPPGKSLETADKGLSP